jgi:hypothetical protein
MADSGQPFRDAEEPQGFFGERCAFAENEALVSCGDYPFSSYVVVAGRVRAVDISTGQRVVFVRYGVGYWY